MRIPTGAETFGAAVEMRTAAYSRVGQGAILVALPLVLYAFMPRPPIGGAHYLAFPSMAGVLAIFVLLFASKRGGVPPNGIVLLLLLLLLNASTVVSFFFNATELRVAALAELFRPAVLVTFLLFGYYVAVEFDDRVVRRGLLLGAQVILVGQAIIGVTQLFGLPIFDLLYSTEKARGLGSLVRVTGTLGNPNTFAWIVAHATVVTLLLGKRRWHWLLLGSLLMLVAGSRTLLLLFPFMLVLAEIWRRGGGLRVYLGGGIFAVLVGAVMIVTVLSLSQYLPYLGQLRILFLSGSLESINSFAMRLILWNSTYAEFSGGGIWTWLIGLGSRDSTRVLDNDFLYVLFRLGLIGFIIHSIIVLYAGRLLWRAGRHPVALIGFHYLVFAIVLSFMYETLGGWGFPLLLYSYVGMSVGIVARLGWQPDREIDQAGDRQPLIAV